MKRTILVADDERLIREPIGASLKLAGYNVLLAKDGREAVAAIVSLKPDLALLDLEMPGFGGMDVLRAIKGAGVATPPKILVLTASQSKKAVLTARCLGVRHFLLKSSFSLTELLTRVESLLSEPTTSPERLGCEGPPKAEPARPADALARPRAIPPREQGPSQQDVAERLRSLKPLMSRDELMKRVLDGADLRALAPAVRQILALTASESASLDDIARAIKQDQALSLKVLKVANSPIYAHAERVESVQKAVARVGIAQIRTMVLSLSVIDRFSEVSLAGRVRAEWFWEHSIACGLIAARLARFKKWSPAQIDAMFTAGLLHDVGRMILAERLGDEYSGVLDTAQQLELPLETIESRLLLINHADVTDRLLRRWHFSAELVNPIALHHLSIGEIRQTAPRSVEEVAMLALANRMAHALVLGCSGNDAIYPIAEFIESLRLNPADIETLRAEIPAQTEDLRLTMMSYGGASTTVRQERCSLLGSGVHPLFVAKEPQTSAIGILLDRLAAPSADVTHNVVVLRVSRSADRDALLSQLKDADRQHGTADAALLVLGDTQSCFYKPGTFGERAVEQLSLPMSQGRLIRALRSAAAAGQAAA